MCYIAIPVVATKISISKLKYSVLFSVAINKDNIKDGHTMQLCQLTYQLK